MIRFQLRWLHPRNWNLRLLWDLFMVWMALINVGLILFDITYLMLRPTYLRFVPALTRVYDPVLGIRPHPLTEALLAESAETAQLLALDPHSPGLRPRVQELRELTLRTLIDNPFQRSGQSRSLEALRALLVRETREPGTVSGTEAWYAAAVNEFWSDDPALLSQRLGLFDTHLRPLLAINYYREVTVDGRLVDHFWLIDLPFLTLFLVEFAVRWAVAVRQRRYARWFFFPIFNWYDLIGLIPYTQFRVFRLLRVASIYMRLRRSEMSRVGRDVLSRAVAYVSNIIAEEISDVVALRILQETQDEIRDGTHARIFDATVQPRRAAIEQMGVTQLRTILADEPTRERIRALLRLNLDRAVESSPALRAVPLPAVVLRPLVRGVGQVVLETTLDTLHATLDSEEGQRAVQELVAGVLDQVLSGPLRTEMEGLTRELSVDVIDHMKRAVAVKKWALPDRETPPAAASPDEQD